MNNPFEHEGQSDDQPSKFRLRQNWCTLFFQTRTPLPTYSILQQGPLPLTTSELYKPIIRLRCSTGTKPAEMKLVVEHTRSCVRYLEILHLE